MFITCNTSFKSSVVLKREDTSSSKNPAKCNNTFVRTVLNVFLKCLTTWIRMVGRAMYNRCICIYFASRILMASTQAGTCQREIFFTINAVLPTFGNSCSLVNENLVSFWMTLELAMWCPALKGAVPVPAECGHFGGTGLYSSFKICLNRQAFGENKMSVFSWKDKEGRYTEIALFLNTCLLFGWISRNYLYVYIQADAHVKLISKIISFGLGKEYAILSPFRQSSQFLGGGRSGVCFT